MTKSKSNSLTIKNEVNVASFSINEGSREIKTPDGKSTYIQQFTVLTVNGQQIWMLPGEAHELVKLVRR